MNIKPSRSRLLYKKKVFPTCSNPSNKTFLDVLIEFYIFNCFKMIINKNKEITW